MTPSDFHLLLQLKTFLHDEVLKSMVESWLDIQAEAFIERDTKADAPLRIKCLNSGGEYVEK